MARLLFVLECLNSQSFFVLWLFRHSRPNTDSFQLSAVISDSCLPSLLILLYLQDYSLAIIVIINGLIQCCTDIVNLWWWLLLFKSFNDKCSFKVENVMGTFQIPMQYTSIGSIFLDKSDPVQSSRPGSTVFLWLGTLAVHLLSFHSYNTALRMVADRLKLFLPTGTFLLSAHPANLLLEHWNE